MNYDKHLYMVLYPSNFLIASQLSPEELGKHYLTGSKQNYDSGMIFAEIDNSYRHDYLDIEWGLDQLVPHDDGTPKATKFIAAYRVLEHIDLDSIKKLYLSSAAGHILPIESEEFVKPEKTSRFKIFAGITPLRMMSVSTLDFEEYGQHMINERKHKGAPVLFYAQLEFNSRQFRIEYDENPLIPSPIPGIHPAILRSKIDEIKAKPEKTTKGLKIEANVHRFPPQLFRHGFMFFSAEKSLYFPMPSRDEIEDNFFNYFRSM
ncbi:hypothetical protein [Spirochaeta isovalerica]|uniref:Uncharacterized protein n=1 Tax=Spirochaeta isovalerica TaxID=150 RepID=A0A841R9Y1_9SPIO|nr:hypothetical protein [Spirochaeta isovalerica]MBB6482174.1 hypothetical protein [Spirochaeta isovalerica]